MVPVVERRANPSASRSSLMFSAIVVLMFRSLHALGGIASRSVVRSSSGLSSDWAGVELAVAVAGASAGVPEVC